MWNRRQSVKKIQALQELNIDKVIGEPPPVGRIFDFGLWIFD